MGAGPWILALLLLLIGASGWISRLTKSYNRVLDELGRAYAKVAQHKILIADLQQLIEDDEDLDKCLRDEIDGKAYERAREVQYEQNKHWFDKENPSTPWVPKRNPK